MVLEFIREETKADYQAEVELFCVTPGEAWRQGRETDEQSIEVTTERPSEAGFYIVHMFDEAYYVYHNRGDAEEALHTAKKTWQDCSDDPDDSDPDSMDGIIVQHVMPGVPWSYFVDGTAYTRGYEALSPIISNSFRC